MVKLIDGNWSNNALTCPISDLGGISTNGYRTLGEGVFYCEVICSASANYKSMGVATKLNQSWVSYGNFTDAIYPIPATSLLGGNVIGILLDLTGSVGKLCYNINGGKFSAWVDLVAPSGGAVIQQHRIAIVGSSSSGGSQTYTLNYNTKTFVTSVETIVAFANADVYVFDGSEKLIPTKIIFRKNNKYYSLYYAQEPSPDNLSTGVTTVTASGGTTPEKTINGVISGYPSSNGWSSSNMPTGWIKYQFKNPVLVSKIKICSYYVGGYEAIKNFTFEGSNTGAFNGEETIIYSGTHPNETTIDFIEYKFTNTKKFLYYRINVQSIHYGNGGDNLSIHEVEFYDENGVIGLKEIPAITGETISNHGMSGTINFDGVFFSRCYVLQDTVSEDTDGLWKTQITRKPLSISFN